MLSEWTAELTCNLYSAHDGGWGATEHLLSDASAPARERRLPRGNNPHRLYSLTIPFPLLCTYRSSGRALRTCSPSSIGLLSPIAQHWDMVQALLHFHGVECFSVLSQAAYDDPSLGLTPLINSARRSAQLHTFDWLRRGLETSSDWLHWVLH